MVLPAMRTALAVLAVAAAVSAQSTYQFGFMLPTAGPACLRASEYWEASLVALVRVAGCFGAALPHCMPRAPGGLGVATLMCLACLWWRVTRRCPVVAV